jgi:hypothetical protein
MADQPALIPSRAAETAWQRIDGEMVILQQGAGRILGLNRVGARVWDLIDGRRSSDELTVAIAAEFGEPEARVAGDVVQFLHELSAAGLIDFQRK